MSAFPNSSRLPSPVRITEQVWPEGTVPVVSIFCITYQHVNFIRDAIEGFLMQETTFPVEIFIHDDASTDGTAEIVKEYSGKYPQLFRTILQTENQWSKGNPNGHFFKLMQKQRGEFIALCEGDDYWICKEKLQKQVEVLDVDPTVALVFHNAWVKHEKSQCDYFMNSRIDKPRFTLDDILKRNWFIATASMVYRKYNPLPSEITQYSMVGDMLIQIAACMQGDAFYLDIVGSVYRRHPNGVSNELWKMEDYHYEKFRPNNIWMYWLLRERLLPASSHLSIELRIRDLVSCILRYAVLHKRASRDYNKLTSYLWDVLRKSKPAYLSDEYLVKGGTIHAIIDREIHSFWKTHRKLQLRNVTNKVIKSIRNWLP